MKLLKSSTSTHCPSNLPCYARRLKWLIAFCTGGLLAFATAGQGFRNAPSGTFSASRAGNSTAQVDDASAVAQNPANLIDLTAPQVQLSVNGSYLKVEYVPPFRARGETSEPWRFEPNAFGVVPLGEGRVVLGLGISTPYGFNTEWDHHLSTFTRFIGPWTYEFPYSAELKMLDFSPAVGVKLADWLQAGAGLDVMWSELTLDQFYPWFQTAGPSAADGRIHESGDAVGIGAHVGLTCKFLERHRVAVTFRSPVDLNHEGDFSVDNVPAADGGGVMRGDFESKVKLPMSVSGAYGIRLLDTLRMEADVEWLQYSRFQSFPLDVQNGPPGLVTGWVTDWKDTWTVGVGGDWEFANGWFLRAGYRFCQSPVREEHFNPVIPDSDRNIVSVGVGFKSGHHSVDVAGTADLYENRFIENPETATPPVDGKYTFTGYMFSVAYQFQF